MKRPTGYLAWCVWAEEQQRAGHRQQQCSECAHWLFPVEQKEHASEHGCAVHWIDAPEQGAKEGS